MGFNRSKANRRHKRNSRRRTGSNKSYFRQTPINQLQEYSVTGRKADGSTTTAKEGFVKTRLTTIDAKNVASKKPRFTAVTVSPNYRPIAWQMPNGYSREVRIVRAGAPSLVSTFPFYPYESVNFTLPDFGALDFTLENVPMFSSTVPWALKQSALLEFNSRVASSKVDFLTSVAEAAPTYSMLANAAKDLFDLFRKVRKADLKGVKRLLKGRNIKHSLQRKWKNKTAENRWLELQYGWLPLIGDITTVLEEFADGKPTPPLYKVVMNKKLSQEELLGFSYIPSPYNNIVSNEVHSFSGFYSTKCYYTVADETLRTKAQWNLGNNPLLTAWELVPYSFVVDWFIPIGDFIAQATATDGLKFVSGTSSYFCKYKATTIVSQTLGSSLGNATVHTPIYHEHAVTRREAHMSNPIGLPYIDIGLSTHRALNALALITQRR